MKITILLYHPLEGVLSKLSLRTTIETEDPPEEAQTHQAGRCGWAMIRTMMGRLLDRRWLLKVVIAQKARKLRRVAMFVSCTVHLLAKVSPSSPSLFPYITLSTI